MTTVVRIDQAQAEAALAEAMETMAFVSPFPADDAAAPAGPLVRTRIEYRGGRSGALELVCPAALGAMLAANLLGCGPDDEEATARSADCLRELVNITCGTLLRKAGGAGAAIVEMEVPTQAAFDPGGWDALVAGGATVLDAEGHKAVVRLAAAE